MYARYVSRSYCWSTYYHLLNAAWLTPPPPPTPRYCRSHTLHLVLSPIVNTAEIMCAKPFTTFLFILFPTLVDICCTRIFKGKLFVIFKKNYPPKIISPDHSLSNFQPSPNSTEQMLQFIVEFAIWSERWNNFVQ